MDQLRRGASIVATDLARAPPPATLRECYQLMCLTVPEVDQIEASISTIKEEIDMRKAAVADKEALLANHNPPVFQAVQVCPANMLGHHPCERKVKEKESRPLGVPYRREPLYPEAV